MEAIIQSIPVKYVAFDVLERQGSSMMGQVYQTRRKVLEDYGGDFPLDITVSKTSPDYNFYHTVVSRGGEGVIAKRKMSNYQPGKRNSNWIKFKSVHSLTAIEY